MTKKAEEYSSKMEEINVAGLKIVHVASLEEVWGYLRELSNSVFVFEFSSIQGAEQQRVVDTVSGVMYVTRGCLKKVSGGVYISIPVQVDCIE